MLSITEYKRTLLIEEIATSLLGLISKKNHIFVVKVLHAKHFVEADILLYLCFISLSSKLSVFLSSDLYLFLL